jgi:hypothetical protein
MAFSSVEAGSAGGNVGASVGSTGGWVGSGVDRASAVGSTVSVGGGVLGDAQALTSKIKTINNMILIFIRFSYG